MLDYTKKDITDLSSLYPIDIRNDFIDSLNETIFNRQLTNQKYSYAIGAIGDDNLSSSIRNILENTEYKQHNQLQPLLSSISNPNSDFMTWKDFLTKMRQQDIHVDNLDEWATVHQFNWVPPIDIDKLVNFRDYYWDVAKNDQRKPDYITIKNRKTFQERGFHEILRITSNNIFNSYTIKDITLLTNEIHINGNVSTDFYINDYIILNNFDGSKTISKIVNVVFDPVLRSTIVTLTYLPSEDVGEIQPMRLSCMQDSVEPNKYHIFGADYTQLFEELTYFNVIESSGVSNIMSTMDVSFDESTNTTTLVSRETSLTSDAIFITMEPLVLTSFFESTYVDGFGINDTEDMLYKILYSYRLNKTQSSTGQIFETTNELYDGNADFFADAITTDDFVTITKNNGLIIEGNVSHVSPDTIEFNSANIQYVFNESNVHYQIYRMVQTEDFFVEPATPFNGQYWVDRNADELKQWATTQHAWVTVARNFDNLYQITKKLKISINTNDWIESNSWIHKTELTALAGMVRAQIPIIEYDDRLFLSSMVYTEHAWSYRTDMTADFRPSDIHPTLFELIDVTNTGNGEITFVTDTKIKLSPTFGNLKTSLPSGSILELKGFATNNTVYVVDRVEYVSEDGHEQSCTIIYLDTPLADINDLPMGATLAPRYTSTGDRFYRDQLQWRYDGVAGTYPTSKLPEKNPDYLNQISGGNGTKSGYNWVSFPFYADTQNPTLDFNFIPTNNCLIDDYQEGDIRVYKNGIRQYGNFLEIPSTTDDKFVGGITFIDNQTFVDGDVVLVELGAYYAEDAGREAVTVITPSGVELVNLSQYKLFEQVKTDINQDIEFIATNLIDGKEHYKSSKIFTYVESDTATLNPYMEKKLATKTTHVGTSFLFRQHLKDGEKMLGYLFNTINGAIQKTVWKSGLNDEMYRPRIGVDAEWEIAKSWQNNLYHENRDEVSYLELYTHLTSILDKQLGGASQHLNSDINYGLGGTIKEYNGNLDILASAMFYSGTTVEELIYFARNQYTEALFRIKDIFVNDITDMMQSDSDDVMELRTLMTNLIIDKISNDTRLSFYFGDTTMYDGMDGVQNWILSTAMMGITPAVYPHIIRDTKLAIDKLIHHDGHASTITLQPSERELIYKNIEQNSEINLTKETVQNTSTPFPLTGDVGDYLLRTVVSEGTRVLYRSNGTIWEEFDVIASVTEVYLEVEKRLYEISKNADKKYDIDDVKTSPIYFEKYRSQFAKFNAERIVNEEPEQPFSQDNPFTWNYYHTVPTSTPHSNIPTVQFASWTMIYNSMFGTPYPHLEPWKVQGYVSKPLWWDTLYWDANINSYDPGMWDNVLDGIVPFGELLPSGIESDGTIGSVQPYDYLPVVTVTTTSDGYNYGELLPPFWNSSNNLGIASIRSIFDPNIGDEMISPTAQVLFGQGGLNEFVWSEDLSYVYDRMVISFKLDPMWFMSKLFGYDKFNIECLILDKHSLNIQPANTALFNGDEYNDSLFRSSGLNQWYINHSRYSGRAESVTDFSTVWRNAEMRLGYLFDSMIDDKSLRVRSEIFDVIDADWNVYPKNTKSYKIKQLNAVDLSLLSVPSKYLGDVDQGWTIELSTIPSIKTPIIYYGVQNYNTSMSGDTFTISSDILVDASYNSATEVVSVNYNNSLRLSDSVIIPIGNTLDADITVDGTLYSISISPNDASNISDVINYLNTNIVGAYFDLELGNLTLISGVVGSSLSIVDNTLFSSIGNLSSVSPHYTKDASFNNILYIRGNKTTSYVIGTELTVMNSAVFNGTYTITSVRYDVRNDASEIQIAETIAIPNIPFVIDGYVTHSSSLPMPDEWVDGSVIFFNSNDNVRGLELDRPYYLIRHGDYSFSIADTETQAKYRKIKDLSSVFSTGSLNVGKIDRTFRITLGNSTEIPWRIHSIDRRIVHSVYDGVSITGMQRTVDFLVGYYTHATDEGFTISNSHVEPDSGRPYSWELYIEKFIDWAYTQRHIHQGDKLEYKVSAQSYSDTFDFLDSNTPPWASGTSVLLFARNGGQLPSPFTGSGVIDVPYYVIKNVDNRGVKLALTSYDAKRGNAIDFHQNSIGDVYMQVYTKMEGRPTFTYAPFRESLGIMHDEGLTDNMHKTPSYVYDINGNMLDSSHIYVSRRDERTDVTLLGKVLEHNDKAMSGLVRDTIYIGGVKTAITTFEHVLIFENYTVSMGLIYDPFVGLRTPRFVSSFRRQTDREKRPTMGGFALLDNTMMENIESGVNNSRYYYDDIRTEEGYVYSDVSKKAIGYDGVSDYMEELGINEKSQYIFWKSMIQNKGTDLAIAAFTNSKILENAEIDEYFAYKVGEFGGIEQKEYIEMKLFTDECSSNELRIEFVRPDSASASSTSSNVIPISLKDTNRWWNQPDQLEAMSPHDTFFITTKPLFVMEYVDIVDNTYVDNHNNRFIKLPLSTEYVDIYYEVNGVRHDLVQNSDYVVYNNETITFDYTRVTDAILQDIVIVGVTYNNDAENASKIIDKKSGTVITNTPFWNPIIGQFDPIYIAPVDIINEQDPAIYEERTDGNIWLEQNKDLIWFNTYNLAYSPYNDVGLYPNVDDRSFNWGKMADWATIDVYQWTASNVSPEKWEKNNAGTPLVVLERNTNFNTSDPENWEEYRDIHIDMFAGMMDINNPPTIYGDMEIYVNGEYKFNRTITNTFEYLGLSLEYDRGSYIHLIKRPPSPSNEELESGEWRYNYKHNSYNFIDSVSGEIITKYYFWVTGKTDTIHKKQRNYTLEGIRAGLAKCSTPYIIPHAVRYSDIGYGLIYGNVFDGFGSEDLPYRYTQIIVKGLEGRIKDNDRYVLRFVKDFNLRDRLTDLDKKNVYEDWKLFREKDFTPVDRFLWNKFIESVIGYSLKDDFTPILSKPLPSMNRAVYDQLYNSDTRFGIEPGRILLEQKEAFDILQSELTSFYVNTSDSYREIIDGMSFESTMEIIHSMNTIYSLLPVQFTNKLFFAVLYAAMSKKREYSSVFKTSWVAIQITQDTKPRSPIKIVDDYLIIGEDCGDEDIIVTLTPIVPTPTPTPSITPSAPLPTPTPTVSPTPTPTPDCYGEFNRAIEDGDARVTEDDECREIDK